MFIIFDAMLGVEHGNGTPAAEFQAEMLSYMPPPHAAFARDFLRRVESTSVTPRDYAVSHGGALKDAYMLCVERLKQLRHFHIGVATKYLIKTKLGTGTSSFRDLLQEINENTASAENE